MDKWRFTIELSSVLLAFCAVLFLLAGLADHYSKPASQRQLERLIGEWESLPETGGDCRLCKAGPLVLDEDKIAFGSRWERIESSSLNKDGDIVVYLENGRVLRITPDNEDRLAVAYEDEIAVFKR